MMTLSECQTNCSLVVKACNFWSYQTETRQCYLKTHRLQPSTNSITTHFISGVKNCPKQEIANKADELVQQKLNILANGLELEAFPAKFGQHIKHGVKVSSSLTTNALYRVGDIGRSKINDIKSRFKIEFCGKKLS
jgi:hypothetical protein